MPRNIFLIFMAFGVAIAGGSSFYYAWCWSHVMEGRTWPVAEGLINRIDIDDHVSEGEHSNTTYHPRLAYTYRVAGRTLYGSRIWLTGNDFYNHREDAEEFVGHYAVGQAVSVSYDPQDPGEAALLVENPPWQILLLTGFGLLWICLSLTFRLLDVGGGQVVQKDYGKCRKCGARLPVDEYMPPGTVTPADRAAAGVKPCPECGQHDPLAARRINLGCLLFGIFFGGMWVIAFVAIYSVF
jgi:hypothetical protein